MGNTIIKGALDPTLDQHEKKSEDKYLELEIFKLRNC